MQETTSEEIFVNPSGEMTEPLSLAGIQVLWSVRRIIQLDTQKISLVIQNVKSVVHWQDLFILFVLGWFLVPILGLVFPFLRTSYPYERSYARLIFDHIQQICKLGTIVYFVDILVVAFVAIGFDFEQMSKMSLGFARILYIGWFAHRLSAIKSYVLAQVAESSKREVTQLGLIDKLIDAVLYLLTGCFLLEILDVQMGVGLSSLFAFGSAGTLMIGLASHDLATMFINGVAMTTTDHFHEGDYVCFGDGTCGTIQKMGWIETTIRHDDDSAEIIPNNRLGMERVCNLTRVKQRRVTTTLRFNFKDGAILEELAQDILEEIKKSCPRVVLDGSRPFRAVWTDIKSYYLEVMVDTHHNVPAGDEDFKARQQVMASIYRTVQRHKIEFAQPPCMCNGSD